MSGLKLREFAEAQAVGVCWVANFHGDIKPLAWDGLHSVQCEWCVYPQDIKLAAVEDYNAWAGQAAQRRAFFGLPGQVRLRLIREAQGYTVTAR